MKSDHHGYYRYRRKRAYRRLRLALAALLVTLVLSATVYLLTKPTASADSGPSIPDAAPVQFN